MSRRKRSRTWKLAIDIADIDRLARKLLDGQVSVDDVICKTSGIWHTGKGTLTMRFAFRTTRGFSVVHTLRNVPIPDRFTDEAL